MTEHTPGPWVQFADQGKCVAIMPAGREGDVCTFQQSPSDADARLMTLAPKMVSLLQEVASFMRSDVQNGNSDLWTTEYEDLHDKIIVTLHAVVSTPSGGGK